MAIKKCHQKIGRRVLNKTRAEQVQILYQKQNNSLRNGTASLDQSKWEREERDWSKNLEEEEGFLRDGNWEWRITLDFNWGSKGPQREEFLVKGVV